MEKKGREPMETDSKYAEFDNTLKSIDRKIKEGNVLGHNKVSAMAEQFANKDAACALTAAASPSAAATPGGIGGGSGGGGSGSGGSVDSSKVQRSVIILWQLQRDRDRITANPYCVCYASL